MAGSIIKEITKDADGTMTVHLENGKVRGRHSNLTSLRSALSGSVAFCCDLLSTCCSAVVQNTLPVS
jgi:hypothetical protein